MPITPDPPFPKSQGDTLRSKDWNDAVNELIRLDGAKANRAGDHFTGPLTIDGNVGIGTGTPGAQLQVANDATIGPFGMGGPGPGRVFVSGSLAELGFARRTLTAWPAVTAAGDRYVWYNPDGTARLWTEKKGDLITVDSIGNVTLTGELALPNTVGGTAAFTNTKLGNEAQFRANNLKLRMGSTGLIFVGLPPLQYEFAVGHTFFSPLIGGTTTFVKRFSVNENGDLFCAGSKTGYVVDFFINVSGEPLQQGDVLVLAEPEAGDPVLYYGSNHDIPIPYVRPASGAYDTGVCGVVARSVTEADLPSVDPPPMTEEEARAYTGTADHPLLRFAARRDEDPDHRSVSHDRLGKMATLGAFAYCKVDADLGAIAVGDLLTTSPTRGHAQKVLEPSRAIGAIVGKALAALESGRATMPVLITLQ